VSGILPEPYAGNLKALQIRSSRLADLVRASIPIDIDIQQSRLGVPSARLGGMWLHSAYDPAAEGRRVAAEAVATGADLILVFGLGLGYAARAALDAGVRVAAIEVDPAVLSALIRAVSLVDLIQNDRFSLVLCPGGQGLGDFLELEAPRSIAVIENQASLAQFPDAGRELKAQAERYRRKDEINAATLKRFGRLWVRNLARNIKPAAAYPGVSNFTDKFRGLPALVLAAGPSLDELEGFLPDLAKRYVMVCVDTALRTMLRLGVEPDFIVVVDPQYWNCRHLDRCNSPSSILVTEAAVWPSVLRFCSRQTVMCSSIYPLGRYVEERLGAPRGSLGAGGSVATTAWDFARSLGCSPIYMAGLDLSFPAGKTHARSSLFEQRSLAEGSRLEPASNASFTAMRGGRPFQAVANDGSPVTSDERLSLYSSWFAKKMLAHPEATTYNLSAHGLAIPGMSHKPLQSLLLDATRRDDIHRRIEEVFHTISKTSIKSGSAADIDAILFELTTELSRLADLSDHAVIIARQALGSKGSVLQEKLAELARIDEAVLASQARDVVGFLFTSAAEAVGGRAKNLDESLERTERLYKAVAESARWHAASLI